MITAGDLLHIIIAQGDLIELIVGEEHTGLLDGLFLLFLGGCGFDLGFEISCEFHDENLRLKIKDGMKRGTVNGFSTEDYS